MKLTTHKTNTLFGCINAPGSKSHSIRALILALLSSGTSELKNVLDSDDTQAAIAVCKKLGSKITSSKSNKTTINSINVGLPLQTNADFIFTGNSGITTRFIMPILGLRENTEKPIILDCDEQMRARPIQTLVNALTTLGMKIDYLKEEGKLPVSVTGKLIGGNVEIDGVTSQYLSALLLSLPCAPQDTKIIVNDLNERPYVTITLNLLNKHNIQYSHTVENNKDIFLIKGNQRYKNFTATIPGDFSSASYLIAAASLLDSQIELRGLDFTDAQGDKRLVTILQEMGANIRIEGSRLLIRGGTPLKGIKIDANDIPDLLPTLAVIGTQASGKTEITNVAQARIKETDRIHSMTEGLQLLGAKVDEYKDGLTIYKSTLKGTELNGYGDHRTVMALSIAGLLASGETVINDAEAINKTYPDYIKHMCSIGAKITLHKHLILLGFKNVGKSTIGRKLAFALKKQSIDLDKEIEKRYQSEFLEPLTCREIMLKHGEDYFRALEHTVLSHALLSDAAVISLGGGTPTYTKNQALLKDHHLMHITAAPDIIYERIRTKGRPAYFSSKENFHDDFIKLFHEREALYKKLTPAIFHNDGSIQDIISKIRLSLEDNT